MNDNVWSHLWQQGGMFDEDTMPDWMRTMRGVAPNAASAAGAPAAVAPAAAASVAAPSTAPQFIPVPEGMPPDANQVIYSATYCMCIRFARPSLIRKSPLNGAYRSINSL